MADKNSTRYIFVTGGVLSGVGKGVTAAALGSLLKTHGYTIGNIKCENYINLDSGTINPIEHGDPFLCNDGLEADMDLGTYERFLGNEMGKKNFTTMGQIYKTVIDNERQMVYEGEDVEHVPHLTNEIIARIKKAGEGYDICLVELGGTAGDYQNAWYYEAARQLKLELGSSVLNIHLSYIVFPPHLGEPKTMPTQTSVKILMSMGIHPDFLVLRGEREIDERRRYILGLKNNLSGDKVITAPDVAIIYELPLIFAEQKFDLKVLASLKLKSDPKRSLKEWTQLSTHVHKATKGNVTIAIVGKYFAKNKGDYQLLDAYAALIESVRHAAWQEELKLEFKFINSEDLEDEGVKALEGSDGIIVPIGWGRRGVEGKISAIRYARENKIPYLGLCYGMQLAAVEFARNVCNMDGANTTEIDETTKYPIIHQIPVDAKYQTIKGKGVSMRLGAYDCILKKGTLAEKIYKKYRAGRTLKDAEKESNAAVGEYMISERHRHRYEFNNDYRKQLEAKGLIISGTSPDNFFVELLELDQETHPFFIATQAHPEYKSTPLKPHPMFLEFLAATYEYRKKL